MREICKTNPAEGQCLSQGTPQHRPTTKIDCYIWNSHNTQGSGDKLQQSINTFMINLLVVVNIPNSATLLHI